MGFNQRGWRVETITVGVGLIISDSSVRDPKSHKRLDERTAIGGRSGSLMPSPDDDIEKLDLVSLSPISELDEMIAMGWGDVPQVKIPSDWRTRRNVK